MLHTWKIGDIKVSSLVEYCGPTHDPKAVFGAMDRARFDAMKHRLPPGHYYPASDKFNIACQIWLVETGDKCILIDGGVGNRKQRAFERFNNLNTLFPHWLAAAGVTRDKVTHMVMTHLHTDHVGWATVLENGKWVPTFPKARHIMPKVDYDYFMAQVGTGNVLDDGTQTDSIKPVVDAGLVDFLTDEREIAGLLRPAKATGHTPGMHNYWISSRGEHGVFSADVMHHPVQVYMPELNTGFCILQDEARKTRAALLAEAARTGALVMPCHFPPPHCGYIRRDGDGYAYEPAKSGYGALTD